MPWNSAVKVLKQMKRIDYTWNVRQCIPYCSLPTGARVSDQIGKEQIPPRADGQSWPRSIFPSSEFVCHQRKGFLLPSLTILE